MIKPLDTILPVMASTPPRWKSLCETLPLELLSRKPAADEWSALECLAHIIDTEKGVFPVRVRAFLAGENFPAFNPDQEGSDGTGQSPASLADDFSALRAESITLLNTLKPGDFSRTAQHAELGLVTLEEMLQEWAGHDLNHTIQAERALMQPFIIGCGPWRGYFESQDFAVQG